MENKMPFLGIINCRDFWKIDYHLHTGGAGFIGSNFIFHMMEKYPCELLK